MCRRAFTISRRQQICPPQRRQKILFHLGKTTAGNRSPGNQHEFNRLGDFVLVDPKRFAEQTPGPAALRSIANPAAGDDAEPRGRAGRQPMPVGNQTTQRQPFTLLPHACEITVLPETRFASQSQAFRRFGGHNRIKRASGVCDRCGGGCAAWPCRSGWNCGSEIRAAVCGGFSMVDTGVSYKFKIRRFPVKTPLTERCRVTMKPDVSRQAGPFTLRSIRAGCRISRCVCAGWRA